MVVSSTLGQEMPTEFVVSGKQPTSFNGGDQCILAIRPEQIGFGSDDGENTFRITVSNLSYLGNVWQIDGQGKAGETFTVQARPGNSIPAVGSTIDVRRKPEQCFLLRPN